MAVAIPIETTLVSGALVLPLVLTGALLLWTAHLARTWWRLRHIPGPFPACVTDLHRVYWVKTKRAHLILQEYHEKHGEVVRIGPNMVSISNPEVLPSIYTTRTGFPKVHTRQEKGLTL